MKEIKTETMSRVKEILENAPIDDKCPLADISVRPKWKCGKFDRGNEPFCKSISGFSKCPHYIKWFYWNLWKMTGAEIAKTKIDLKKKEAKKK